MSRWSNTTAGYGFKAYGPVLTATIRSPETIQRAGGSLPHVIVGDCLCPRPTPGE